MRAPGSSTIAPWPGASRAGSSARSARALSITVGRCHVASAGSGKRGLGLADVATPPSVENVSPQYTVRSRVSSSATWPGVCPGLATTSSEPTRSPGVSVGEHDPADRPAELGGGLLDALGTLGEAGVDEREAVVLLDEVDVDHAEAGDACGGHAAHCSGLRSLGA